jgi:murein DD-endopeptidase MepM/ murein hydrolase activator NlpD
MSINFINKLSKRISEVKLPNIKKMAVTSIFTTSIALGVATNPLAVGGLTTVHYVYLNNEYIGTISNLDVINQVVEEKVKKLEAAYQDQDITIGSQLSFIPEQVFRSTANDQSVIDKIEKELKPLAEAAAVVIGNESAVYLEDEKMAKEVLESLKLKYVTKEQLQELEFRQKSPNITTQPLKENESRLYDVYFSENVTVKEEKVIPDKILTVAEALKLIQKGTLEEVKYKVQDGDVLGSIAVDHNLEISQLLNLNAGLTEDSVLQIDQEINVTVPKPLVRVIVEKEVFLKEEIPYQKQVQENDKMYKGDTKVKQQGKEGVRAVNYLISEQNGKTVKKEVKKEEILVAPVNHIVMKGTKVIPSRGDGSFVWPTSGGYVSSQMGYRWSRMHKGIDIAQPSNRTIKTVDNGIVVSAGWDGGYGNKVVVNHQNGYRTVYAHLSSIDVNVGQTVPKGSTLGQMGSTGDSTGIHLHFEVYKNGKLVNPLTVLR